MAHAQKEAPHAALANSHPLTPREGGVCGTDYLSSGSIHFSMVAGR
jgi:hypothetical protein